MRRFLVFCALVGPRVWAADCAFDLGDDSDARAVVAGLEADWTLADEALDLVASIRRSQHAIDRMLGRPPQGPGDAAVRAEFSVNLMRREWEHLHALDAAVIAHCLAEAAAGPSVSSRLREALANAHLDFESYLALPGNQARLTGPWVTR